VKPNDSLSVGQIAELCGISRQTLIFYDKINIFKPYTIDQNNNYRYYTVQQIPLLREILLLKTVGVPLKDIKLYLKTLSLETSIALLQKQDELVSLKVKELDELSRSIKKKLSVLSEAKGYYKENEFIIMVKEIPARRVATMPFGSDSVDLGQLRHTHMHLFNTLMKHRQPPLNEFGTLIPFNCRSAENLRLKTAGVYVCIDEKHTMFDNTQYIEGGKYVCVYKYGMPYDLALTKQIVGLVEKSGFEIAGDYIVDRCLLDAKYYSSNQRTVDFCELQIPVK